jgi:transcription elongation factor Elf1
VVKRKLPKLFCPYCGGVISNLKKLWYSKVYQCKRCKGKYFIQRVPKEILYGEEV